MEQIHELDLDVLDVLLHTRYQINLNPRDRKDAWGEGRGGE